MEHLKTRDTYGSITKYIKKILYYFCNVQIDVHKMCTKAER